MSGSTASWIDCLDNALALSSTFDGAAPLLDQVVLAQFVIDQPGGVYVSLTLPALPAGSPARWVERQCDRVQLRLAFFDVGSLALSGAVGEGNAVVSAEFPHAGRFVLSSPLLNAELRYEHVKGQLYPFDASVFEEPQQWFRV